MFVKVLGKVCFFFPFLGSLLLSGAACLSEGVLCLGPIRFPPLNGLGDRSTGVFPLRRGSGAGGNRPGRGRSHLGDHPNLRTTPNRELPQAWFLFIGALPVRGRLQLSTCSLVEPPRHGNYPKYFIIVNLCFACLRF